ncbi:MAG: DUF2085 domain-containing protein [Pseudomonadota bacterium]
MKVERIAALVVAVFSLLVCIADFVVPLFMALGLEGASSFFRDVLSLLCHQHFDRSLTLLGWQMGLCSRCSAIFLSSFLAGAVVALKPGLVDRKLPAYMFALAGFIVLVAEKSLTFALQIDFHTALRMLVGALYGAGVAVLFVRVAGDLTSLLLKRRT